MALESATTINQLVATNPTLTDPKAQGDDHLRLIKSTLKNTFPNITGVVTVTQDQLNVLTDPTVLLKPGMIMLWGGAIVNIPAGWVLCNGVGTVTGGIAVPNLLDKFVLGAGGASPVGTTGGNLTHNHTISVNGTSITVDQLPPHTHDIVYGAPSGGPGYPGYDGSGDGRVSGLSGVTGTGNPHTHGAVSSTVNHLPPYLALAYIIKS
jgi:hypothetical protein